MTAGAAALLTALVLACWWTNADARATRAPDARQSAGSGASGAKINDLADAFLVEEDGGWFCKEPGKNHPPSKLCPRPSWQAATDLIQALGPLALANPGAVPDYMRVAKARNNCTVGDRGDACATGVPDPPPDPAQCAVPFTDVTPPSCALAGLNFAGVRLGIVISAANGKSARPVKDIAWQACQVNKADLNGYFSFVFLDLASRLKPDARLKRAVTMIQEGQIRDETGKLKECTQTKKHLRWSRLITNDRGYRAGDDARLDTGAWAHAADITLLASATSNAKIGAALKHNRVLRPLDKSFFRSAARVGSQAVLRFEVTSQTGKLATLTKKHQCQLLKSLASQQHKLGYTLDFPFYVHGLDGGGPGPGDPMDAFHETYDSFAQGTFTLQTQLIGRYGATGSQSNPAPPC